MRTIKAKPLAIVSVVTLLMLMPMLPSPASSLPDLTRASEPYSISGILEIPPGGFYGITVSENGTKITPDPVLDPIAVLSALPNGTEIVSAVQRAPDWMEADLTKQMLDLAQLPLDQAGPAWGICFADMDGDDDLDMLVGDEGLIYYENKGTPYQSQFLEADIGLPDNWSSGRLYPTVGDINDDGMEDIIFGDSDGRISCLMGAVNSTTGEREWTEAMLFPGFQVSGGATPFLVDLDDDGDLDIVSGSDSDGIVYFENAGNETDPFYIRNDNVLLAVQVGDVSKPGMADLNGDNAYDLIAGDQDGNLYYYQNLGTPSNPVWGVNNPTVLAGVKTGPSLQLAPADIDGDSLIDIVSNFDSGAYFSRNYGSASTPRYVLLSSYEYVPSYNYYPRDVTFDIVSQTVPLYFARVINMAEPRYIDEVAFCVAHMSVADLRYIWDHDMGEVLIDNAYYIYYNAQYLNYATMMDYNGATGNFYTTVKYSYRGDSGEEQRELPRDIYYWYVVHPKVSTQRIAYVNPESGEPMAKAQGGRFWREYLFWHADDKYPANPGNGVNYPVDAPPLLKDKISSPGVIHDGISYSAPGGYANNGTDNNRPFGFRDTAIDAVSNWVAKTLPLNEAESGDGERPLQPVRIAHGHNGNCGELHDLTISAGRTCLIPTAGVGMPGEDHTWSEFWLDGWHQWDNYWSDGGADIDNFYTYWEWWGGSRTGSGVYKEEPYSGISDVSKHYIPPEAQSHIKVTVLDRDGKSVDGARVTLLSHWLTEQQLDEPVTVPVPDNYNYTDAWGNANLTAANRNVSLKVISRLGNAAENKFYVGSGRYYNFTYRLEGAKPWPTLNAMETGGSNPANRWIALEYKVLDSVQYPPDASSGDIYAFNQPTGKLDAFVCYDIEYDWFKQSEPFMFYSSLKVSKGLNGGVLLFEVPSDSLENYHIVLSDHSCLETSMRVWYRVTEYDPSDMSWGLDVKTSYPLPDSNIEVGEKVQLFGTVVCSDTPADIQKVEISLDGGATYRPCQVNLTKDYGGKWSYLWDTSQYLPLPPGLYTIMVKASTPKNYSISQTAVRVVDTTNGYLRITSPRPGSSIAIGPAATISGMLVENYRVSSVRLFMDSKYVKTIPIDATTTVGTSVSWSTQIDTGSVKPGTHALLVLVQDDHGYEAKNIERFNFVNQPPAIELDRPANATEFPLDSQIVFSGRVSDDQGVASLLLHVFAYNYSFDEDISNTILDRNFSYTLNAVSLTEGDYNFSLSAKDALGATGTYNGYLTMVQAPDEMAPTVSIGAPSDGAMFPIGSQVEVKGTAFDDIALKSLTLVISGSSGTVVRQDLLDSWSPTNNAWRYVWETSGKKEDNYKLAVEAYDTSDNFVRASVNIIVYEPTVVKDREAPVIRIIDPTTGSETGIGTSLKISGSATDDIEMANVKVSVDGGFEFEPAKLAGEDWTFDWAVPFSTTPGDVMIVAKATDAAGRFSTDSIVITLADRTRPVVSMALMGNSVEPGTSVVILINASDNDGIVKLELNSEPTGTVLLDSGSLGKDYGMEYAYEVPVDTAPGSIAITVTVRDASGNTATTSATLTVVVPKEKKEEGSGSSYWWIAALAGGAILAVFLMVVFYLMIIKRR